MEEELFESPQSVRRVFLAEMEPYLVDWHILDLLTPERFAIDKPRIRGPCAFLIHHDAASIRRGGRLHRTCSFRLQCLLWISVDEAVQERDEGVEGDIG